MAKVELTPRLCSNIRKINDLLVRNDIVLST
jgi:hypothetical protein